MIKMIKAELFRLKHAKHLLIFPLILILVFLHFISNDVLPSASAARTYDQFTDLLKSYATLLLIIATMICAVNKFVIEDFSNKSSRFYITAGISRTKYYFTKLLYLCVLFVFFYLFLQIALASFIFINLSFSIDPSKFLLEFIGFYFKNFNDYFTSLLAYLLILSIYFSLSIFFKTGTKTILTFLVLICLTIFIDSILFKFSIDFEIAFVQIQTSIFEHGIESFSNFYLRGAIALLAFLGSSFIHFTRAEL